MSDILDTIDGAIWDWEFSSPDAMRWRPPEQRSGPEREEIVVHNGAGAIVARWHAEGESLPVEPFRVTGHTYDHAAGTMTFHVEVDPRRYTETMRRLSEALARLTEQFRGMSWDFDEAPPLETSRERALRLMQERSHGPDMPICRRPRELP